MKPYRIALLIFVMALLSTLCPANELNKKDATRAEYLESELSHTYRGERLAIINELASLYWDVPEEEHWYQTLYEESMSLDSLKVAETALKELSRYYHNTEQTKKLVECSEKEDQLVQRIGKYSDNYFTIKMFLCERYLWDEHYDIAIYEVKQMREKALLSKSKFGEQECEIISGLIYQSMERPDQADIHLKKAYKLAKELNASYSDIAQLASEIIEVNLKLNNFSEVLHYIHIFEEIQEKVTKGIIKDSSFPIQRNWKMIETYYADYYIRDNKPSKAFTYLKKAESISESDVYVDFLLAYAQAKYYKTIGDYSKSLEYIDKVVAMDGGSNIEYRQFRAEIYLKLGKPMEAMNEYRTALQIHQDSSSVQFDRNVASLQHIYESQKMEIQLKDNELQIKEMRSKELAGSVIFLLITVCGMAIYLIREKKYQKILQEKNASLLDMQVRLDNALQRANEVDRLKNNFLHNISHEIRTPLNAIVGFSEELTDQMEGLKDCKEYCEIIKDNTHLLLDLINKIIEASKYETAQKPLSLDQLSPCVLSDFCKNALKELNNKGTVAEGVQLHFEGKPEDLVLSTAAPQLKQLIMNLLDNAAKNTSQGSITLSYGLSPDAKYVLFSVADTGKGIPAEMQDIIFRKFEKADEFGQGVGLGLSLCDIIARQLQGEIHLDKSYKTGARFVFNHPVTLKH